MRVLTDQNNVSYWSIELFIFVTNQNTTNGVNKDKPSLLSAVLPTVRLSLYNNTSHLGRLFLRFLSSTMMGESYTLDREDAQRSPARVPPSQRSKAPSENFPNCLFGPRCSVVSKSSKLQKPTSMYKVLAFFVVFGVLLLVVSVALYFTVGKKCIIEIEISAPTNVNVTL